MNAPPAAATATTATACQRLGREMSDARYRSRAYPQPTKAMRLISDSRGGVNPSSWGRRPSKETSERRTMARARKPRERSRRLAQPIPTATPRRTNPTASTFAMTAVALFMSPDSRSPEPVEDGDLGREQVDQLRVPLPARATGEDGDRLVLSKPSAIGPVAGQRVERVAHGHDPAAGGGRGRALAG